MRGGDRPASAWLLPSYRGVQWPAPAPAGRPLRGDGSTGRTGRPERPAVGRAREESHARAGPAVDEARGARGEGRARSPGEPTGASRGPFENRLPGAGEDDQGGEFVVDVGELVVEAPLHVDYVALVDRVRFVPDPGPSRTRRGRPEARRSCVASRARGRNRASSTLTESSPSTSRYCSSPRSSRAIRSAAVT